MLSINRRAGAILFAVAQAAIPCQIALAQDATTIVMKNFDYSPMVLTVRAGSIVTWKNMDGEPHTVTSLDGAFRSGALDQGDSFSFKFEKAGTYKYVCSIHPKMMAAIVVQ